MQKTKLLGIAAAAAFAMIPASVHADDATTDAQKSSDASDSACMQDCLDQCNNKTGAGATVTPEKKSLKYAQNGTGAGTSTQNNGVNVNVQPAPSDAAAIDQARAEERARAAEEFRSEEQRLNAEHSAELDRVRAEERDMAAKKAEADISAVRAEEQHKADVARADRERATKARGPIIEKALITPVGVYGQVGGGVGDFTQPSASGTTNVGGNWDARIGIGTRSVLGLEADYNGGARDITALGLNDSAYLLNNGVEGVARLNVPITVPNTKTLVEPYTFGGLGWQHYNLMNTDGTNTSDVSDSDDIMSVPMGVGLNLGFAGFTIDGRATYRHALFNDLLGSPTSSFDTTSLNSWEVGAEIGRASCRERV